jgi:hypothetical protein
MLVLFELLAMAPGIALPVAFQGVAFQGVAFRAAPLMCAGSVVQKPVDHRGRFGGVAVVAIFLLRFEFLQKIGSLRFEKSHEK